MYNVVNTLGPLFLIGCSSFLQIARTTIRSRTSFKFGHIGLRTVELAVLERLESKKYARIREISQRLIHVIGKLL